LPLLLKISFRDLRPRRVRKFCNALRSYIVRAVWVGKIYAALPKDKTTVPEYFLDAELEQFLNEAIEECHKQVCLIAERAKEELS
jgi:hypothetical protein